jgi:hypothetical protein
MLLRRRLAVLVATASIAVMMLLAMAPVAMAAGPGSGQSPFAPLPAGAPGSVIRSPTGSFHGQHLHPTGRR